MRKALPRQHVAQAMNGFSVAVKIREWHPSPRCHLQPSPYSVHNSSMRLRWRAAGIHHCDALQLSCRNRQIAFVYAGEESSVLLLEAVFIGMMFVRILTSAMRSSPISAPRPPHTHRRIGVEQDRHVGLQISTKHAMQLKHRLAAKLPAAALVRFRGISEAITKHNLPVLERRLNHLCNVLRPRSEHQSHFRERRQSLGRRVEQDAANLLASRRSSGLARFYHLMPCRAQSGRQLAHLRALAGSVQPFERDEFPAPRHRGDDSSAGALLYVHSCTSTPVPLLPLPARI